MRSWQTRGLGSLLLILAAHAWACSPNPASTEATPFPAAFAQQLLDQPPDKAFALIEARYTEVSFSDGPLRRAFIDHDPWLEEIVLFTNLRSGRVDTVILKYRPALSPDQVRRVLDETGVEGLANELDRQETSERPWQHLTLRARRADRQGRLTLTLASEQKSL